MRWMQALVFCGGLLYAAVDDLKTRTVSDIVCIIIALAGLVTISPASFLGALLAMLPFYLCAGLGLMGGGDWRLAAAVGFVLGVDRVSRDFVSWPLRSCWLPLPCEWSRHCERAQQQNSRWFRISRWLLSPHISSKEAIKLKIFRNRTVIGVLCILLALIICFGLTPMFSRSASEKAEIVRVTADIKEGDEIIAEKVQTVEVGAYNLPQNIMTDKNEVIGKYATADLKVGDYILASKLSTVPAAENAYLYNLDGTKKAISVTIKSFATGLSGKLESGDIVSVIVADYQGKGETVIPAELQYVEVISVTASSGYDANTGEAVAEEKELPSTVTLLVTTEQAKVLAELEQDSELHLALVYRGTPENAAKFIEAQDALIGELYAEPDPEAEGTETEESEAADPNAESEATGE